MTHKISIQDSNKDLEKGVRGIIKGFCRWTSVRGMSHVVRSDSSLMTKVWVVFVLIMLISNIVLVTLVVKRYNDGNTIENIKTERRHKLEFPSVTVCNVDPINTDKMYCLRNKSEDPMCKDLIKNYGYVLDAYIFAQNLSFNASKETVIPQHRTKINILYQLIGRDSAEAISHRRKDLIVDHLCRVYYYEDRHIFDGNLLSRPCSESNISYTAILNPHYFNCYRITVENEDLSKRIRKISMVLYLDEEEDLLCRPHCTHEVTEWSGAKAVVHPTNTFPEIDEQGLNLLPGASNQLLIKEVRMSDSLNVKQAPCQEQENNGKTIDPHYMVNMSGVLMNYTDYLCIGVEYQSKIIKECQCVDAALPIPTNNRLEANALPFCGNLTHKRQETMQSCNRRIKTVLAEDILKSCLISCRKLDYFIELTQLRWPQKPQILHHYKKFKKYVYYERKLKAYERIEDMTPSNASEALEALLKVDTFEKNFLQVEVIRANFDIIKYKESEEYTLPTILSQIGGICSIFLGVTFVTLLEIIELIYQIYSVVREGDTQESNETQGTTTQQRNGMRSKDTETTA